MKHERGRVAGGDRDLEARKVSRGGASMGSRTEYEPRMKRMNLIAKKARAAVYPA
jgi:hypothetical protein